MDTNAPRDASRALVGLGTTAALHGTIHTLGLFLSPLNAEIAGYFGLTSIATVTAFKTVYLVVYAGSNLLFGALTNRLPAREVLGLGMIVNALAVVLFRFVPPTGVGLMYLLWIVAALGGGVYHPVANAFITRLYPLRKGWALGITGMGAGIGYAFGPLLTGFLSGVIGLSWRDISLVFGGLGLAVGAAAFLLIPRTPRAAAPRAASDRAAGGGIPPGAVPAPAGLSPAGAGPGAGLFGLSYRLWVFLLFIVVITGTREIGMWTILDISDFFLKVSFPGGPGTAWFLFLMYLPGVFVQPLAGALSDRVGRGRLVTAAFLFYGAAVASLAFVPGRLLFLPYMLMGAASTASVPVMEALVTDFTNPRTRGLVFGVFVTAIMGIGALGPLAGGLYLDALGHTAAAFRSWMLLSAGLIAAGGIALMFTGRLASRLGLTPPGESPL